MKRAISILSFVFAIGVLSANAQCCNKPKPGCESTTSVTTPNQSKTEVQAYYFHATRRCATCQAVESVTKDAIKEYYGDKVSFQSLNIEDDINKSLIEKYKISGQTLIIIKGDKVVDLTNDAFMNARTNPDKLKAKIKSTIDSI